MAMIEVPDMSFSTWAPWYRRERLSQDVSRVPPEFGIVGLYLLATSEVDEVASGSAEERHLHPSVLYIGWSTHVDRRLEYHEVARRYAKLSGGFAKLRYSIWKSDWTNGRRDLVIATASVRLYERALLLSYVEKFGRLPKLNRR